MVRLSKQQRKRSVSYRRPQPPAPKSGPKKDNLSAGFRPHPNAAEGDLAAKTFIPKIK